MKIQLQKQIQAFKDYIKECIADNAHIGLAFYTVIILLGVALYKTM